jgi:hypothetical protein
MPAENSTTNAKMMTNDTKFLILFLLLNSLRVVVKSGKLLFVVFALDHSLKDGHLLWLECSRNVNLPVTVCQNLYSRGCPDTNITRATVSLGATVSTEIGLLGDSLELVIN